MTRIERRGPIAVAASLLFALGYWVTFPRPRARLGFAGRRSRSAPRALFAGTTLGNVLLPAVHPRLGTPYSSARDAPLLEPPGCMLLNYGRATPVVTVLAHVACGAIIGFLIGSAP